MHVCVDAADAGKLEPKHVVMLPKHIAEEFSLTPRTIPEVIGGMAPGADLADKFGSRADCAVHGPIGLLYLWHLAVSVLSRCNPSWRDAIYAFESGQFLRLNE